MADLDVLWLKPHTPPDECSGEGAIQPNSGRDLTLYVLLSFSLGVPSFVAFCILRRSWPGLYAARKRRLHPEIALPSLPDTFWGWLPSLYRVTDGQVLASAGLDAYVFLKFFKMSAKLFAIMFFFALVVLFPVNKACFGQISWRGDDNSTMSVPIGSSFFGDDLSRASPPTPIVTTRAVSSTLDRRGLNKENQDLFNNSYLFFCYFFCLLTLWFVDRETRDVIRVRQEYLGQQATITDRTFQLSGIPASLRSEEGIRKLIRELGIGRVKHVSLCRQWKSLDALVQRRAYHLSRLERAWSVYNHHQPHEVDHTDASPTEAAAEAEAGRGEEGDDSEDDDLQRSLLGLDNNAWATVRRERPTVRVWTGFLGLRSKSVDAIDYYEERVRRLDEQIRTARLQSYEPADLAFVTMDSIASCQMATQAILDPRPGVLQTSLAPSPSDVVWANTYLTRAQRMVKSWTVTSIISVLSVFWVSLVAIVASLLSVCTIEKTFPGFAEKLEENEFLGSIVRSGVPLLVVTILNLLVPFLYEALSHRQGLVSRGQLELSLVSKNFFFTFFNFFFIFTFAGSASQFWPLLRQVVNNASLASILLAQSILRLSNFYIGFIMLQGIGLTPFRLLEPGGVFFWFWSRMHARSPRDFAQMRRPPVFNYGFYLPTALLVFILCLVYSVLQKGFLVLLMGVAYFVTNYFTYKYQLLYAMDQPQHATGGAWRLISYRILMGVFIFLVVMTGIIGIHGSWRVTPLLVPLYLLTFWYANYFRQQHAPLTRCIALRSIGPLQDAVESERSVEGRDRGMATVDGTESSALPLYASSSSTRRDPPRLRRGSTLDEERERGAKFLNPSLTATLPPPWIYGDRPPEATPSDSQSPTDSESSSGRDSDYFRPLAHAHVSSEHLHSDDLSRPGRYDSDSDETSRADSQTSLGNTHVWRS